MVLVLQPLENHECFYFDCRFVSTYNESELLFFGGDSILKIVTIKRINDSQWVDYIHYLQAIHFLLTLMRGGDYTEIKLSNNAQKQLINMIKYKLNTNKKNKFPKYIIELLSYHMMNAPKSITINLKEFTNSSHILRDLFVKLDGTLNLVNIIKLCPVTNDIVIQLPNNYIFDDIFINSLYDELNELSSSIYRNKMIQFIYDGPIEYNQYLINGQYTKFAKINWEIKHSTDCTAISWNKYYIPNDQYIKIDLSQNQTIKHPIESFQRDIIIGYAKPYFIPNVIIQLIYDYDDKIKEFHLINLPKKIKIWIVSWNMSSRKYDKLTINNLSKVLPDGYDLYIIGIQKAVSAEIFNIIKEYLKQFNISDMYYNSAIQDKKQLLD